jgi:hypothetical protein
MIDFPLVKMLKHLFVVWNTSVFLEKKEWNTNGNILKVAEVRQTYMKKITYILSPTHFSLDKQKVKICKIIIGSREYLKIPFVVYLRSPNDRRHVTSKYIWTNKSALMRLYTMCMHITGRRKGCLNRSGYFKSRIYEWILTKFVTSSAVFLHPDVVTSTFLNR